MNGRPAQTETERALQRCIVPGCDSLYGIGERIYVCPRCGGPLEIELRLETVGDARALRKQWETRSASMDARDRSGVWRFRELLPFDDAAPVVTLFEGNTPLYDAPRCAEYCGLAALRLKHQGCNPTGSFKDTGMTTAVTHAVLLGARTVVCASTGNTAASLAAYAARARLQCVILVPRGQISAAKLAQAMDYGAAVLEIEGNFDAAMRLVQELGDDASIYIANSINPFRIEGQKTVAFELMQQCAWRVPDQIVVPGGNMGNSSALGKGFEELARLGLADRLPKINVIQAEGAAPLARLFESLDKHLFTDGSLLPEKLIPVEHPRTLATAIRIGAPVSWKKGLRAVLRSHGQIIAVSEQEIADAKAMIGRDGIGCEPASATTVAGIRKLVVSGHIQREESVVAVLTGHLLKDPDYVSHYHRGTLSLSSSADAESGAQPIRGAFRNPPESVAATKSAILDTLKRRRQRE
ncbi:MAG: threonine synthase [Candidatus Acidiferrales bacterium]